VGDADLTAPERFDRTADLLLEIAVVVPSAPSLTHPLGDRRAEGRWNAIRRSLEDLTPNPPTPS
jgi:hypothetical protein